MDPAFVFCVGLICGLVTAILLLRKSLGLLEARVEESEADAYTAGVRDGYGYAQSPWEKEYLDVGQYLKANCAHKWPELGDDEDDD